MISLNTKVGMIEDIFSSERLPSLVYLTGASKRKMLRLPKSAVSDIYNCFRYFPSGIYDLLFEYKIPFKRPPVVIVGL